MGYINSFVLTDDPEAIERGRKCGVTEFTVATRFPRAFENLAGVTVYKTVDKPSDCDYPRLFLPELTDDAITDAVAEAVLSGKSSAIIAAGYSLDESGAVDVRFHLSPVQLVHKLGLLDGGTIVGGVYLDRDDVDLMAQCGARLILCPTSSMGHGFGIPHFPAYIKKLDVRLGSGDNRFNRDGDMPSEARALLLGCNAEMRDEKSVDVRRLFGCFSDEVPDCCDEVLFGSRWQTK